MKYNPCMKKLLLLLLLSLGLIGNSYSETKVPLYQTEVAYQSKLAYDAKVAQLMQELAIQLEIEAFEAQLKAELAAQEMMTEIEAELAHQLALENFQKKLASEPPAMMMKVPYVPIWKCKKDYRKSENSCIKEKLEDILIDVGAVKPSQGGESITVDYLETIIKAREEGNITEEELNKLMKIINID
jgi:hypothetical protein